MRSILHLIKILGLNFVHYVIRNPQRAHRLYERNLSLYLKMMYCNWQNCWPNLKHPKNFNHWLLQTSLENSLDSKMRKLIPLCVDKYTVRQYIEKMGYGDTLNDCYGVYERVDDIDFYALPQQFVMKMTNASGRNYICTDKSKCDWQVVRSKFSEWLEDTDFGWQTGEWQYRLIRPRIVVEKFLENLGESSLIDYKFNVINSKVYSCFVAYNRDNNDAHNCQVCFDDYDREWNRTEAIKPGWHISRKMIAKPVNYDRMIEMAETCSRIFPYCRFDVYEIDGKIMFGEMTFTPQGCVLEFYEDWWLRQVLKDIEE